MDKIKEELRYWYKIYQERDDAGIDDVRMEELWQKLYESDPMNADYAVGYALFLTGIDVIGDHLKAAEILEPFREDPRCAIIRCNLLGWWIGDEKVIESYDFNKLIENAKSRQEKSLLFYYKAIASDNCVILLDKSLESFRYNYICILDIIDKTNDKEKYKNLYIDCERFFLKLCYQSDKNNRHLFYKAFLYQSMGLINQTWDCVLYTRKYRGFCKDELPSIDLTNFKTDKYFNVTINEFKDYCNIIVDGKLIE